MAINMYFIKWISTPCNELYKNWVKRLQIWEYEKKRNVLERGKQGKSEGFDSCDRPSNHPQIGSKSSFFSRVTLNVMTENPFQAHKSHVCHLIVICGFKLESLSENAEIGAQSRYFGPCDLEIWWMTSKKQQGASSMPRQTLCIISLPPVNSI